ncbi:hypothetical protein [Janthinobacterium sp. J1-1]|uniref:hypothetical protein n=1 Tax=Janthinobacterium sp. J1-1 TaxID=3065910 RepID=UPI00281265B7|nr:hypothetical protein [Janthinobacterium sp. J1-1]
MTYEELKELLAITHNPMTLTREMVPTLPGLYVWRSKHDDSIEYIGKASGKNGLRGRVWCQHLNPIYLESRPDKIAQDDAQRGFNILHNGKLCIDKSVFRRSIGKAHQLSPGVETVRHIRENCTIAWVTFSSDLLEYIPRWELDLIKDYPPRLNKAGNRHS